jgi:transposase-like protein
VKILRLRLLEGKAVSDVCEEHEITPAMFYQSQKAFFENGARALAGERAYGRAATITSLRLRPRS